MQNFENQKKYWFIYWDAEKQDYVLVHGKKKEAE